MVPYGRWDSNPILEDLPEVAIKCATDREFVLREQTKTGRETLGLVE
jgi:hypothetical protein